MLSRLNAVTSTVMGELVVDILSDEEVLNDPDTFAFVVCTSMS